MHSFLLDPVQYRFDQAGHGTFVFGIHVLGHPTGNNAAHGHGTMSHQGGQSGERRTFHFEVGNPAIVELESFYFTVQFRIGERQAELHARLQGPSDKFSGPRIPAQNVPHHETVRNIRMQILRNMP